MTDEERNTENLRFLAAHQTDEQNERHRIRNLAGNLSLDQLDRRAQADQMRQNQFKPMAQEWDYDNPCSFCQAVWLKSDSTDCRKACCKEGLWKTYENQDADTNDYGFPAMKLTPPVLKGILTEKSNFFTTQSAYYNNLFSIGITGVDNGRQVGYEVMNMDACVKLNGRTYHR
jgi:hypothetical protein